VKFDSTAIYHKIKEVWKEQGIIFEDLSHAIKEYPDLVKDHFMKVVPPRDHKFAALHGAVWS
jgi:Fe-S cluster assembly protein SufB